MSTNTASYPAHLMLVSSPRFSTVQSEQSLYKTAQNNVSSNFVAFYVCLQYVASFSSEKKCQLFYFILFFVLPLTRFKLKYNKRTIQASPPPHVSDAFSTKFLSNSNHFYMQQMNLLSVLRPNQCAS